MCAWADRLGFATVLLSEHHNTSDGYLPSPIVMAGAVGARTTRIDIKISVVLATLMHPVHLAEDLAVADLICGGRLHVTLGAGYRKPEILAFQVDWKKRPSMMVEIVETLRTAWTGEEFDFRGTRIRVLPLPARPGGPPLALAGTSEASARRAPPVWISPTSRSASSSTGPTSTSWAGSAKPGRKGVPVTVARPIPPGSPSPTIRRRTGPRWAGTSCTTSTSTPGTPSGRT